MERRGFFGTLVGMLALPFVWRKYPPVVWLSADPGPNDWKRQPPYHEGQVYRCYKPPDEVCKYWDPFDWRVWRERIRDKYFVVTRVPLTRGGSMLLPEAVDHRPTWAEVRDLLARKAKT